MKKYNKNNTEVTLLADFITMEIDWSTGEPILKNVFYKGHEYSIINDQIDAKFGRKAVYCDGEKALEVLKEQKLAQHIADHVELFESLLIEE